MSDQSIFLSNGTCYSSAGTKLDSSFIPCGNDAFGHQTCCGAGDNCLADNACFGFHGNGYGSYLTYMAGCTDPDYKDSSCPDKDGIDQPWIALTLCDNSGGAWAACSQSGNPSTLQPGSYCSCTDSASATVAFKDTASLTSICSLPQSTGASISFFAGHTPSSRTSSSAGTSAAASSSGPASGSATTTQTGSGASSKSGTGAGNSASATSTQTGTITSTLSGTGAGGSASATSTQTGLITSTLSGTSAGGSGTSSPSGSGTTSSAGGTSSGLSSGAKIGIGVGAGLGGLVLLAAIAACFFLRRRRRRRSPPEPESRYIIKDTKDTKETKPPKADSSDHQRISAMSSKPTASEADGQEVAEVEGRAAQPWPMRNELEGRQVVPSNQAEHTWGNAVVGGTHDGQVRRSGDLNPVAELPGSEGWQEDRPHGVGQGPPHSGGYGPRQGPRGYRGVEMTSQATPAVGGLSVVGPEGAHFSSEQGPA